MVEWVVHICWVSMTPCYHHYKFYLCPPCKPTADTALVHVPRWRSLSWPSVCMCVCSWTGWCSLWWRCRRWASRSPCGTRPSRNMTRSSPKSGRTPTRSASELTETSVGSVVNQKCLVRSTGGWGRAFCNKLVQREHDILCGTFLYWVNSFGGLFNVLFKKNPFLSPVHTGTGYDGVGQQRSTKFQILMEAAGYRE